MDKQLVELINKYGLDELEQMIELNKLFIEHMISKESYDFKTPTLFCETESGQIFSNGKTSLFYLNKKIFDTDILKYSKLERKRKIIIAKPEDFNEFLETMNRYKKGWYSSAKTIDFGGPYVDVFTEDGESFSKSAYKLLNILLQNPKTYISVGSIAPVMFAENEHGKAYIIGKKEKEGQTILK